jgi:hypothetical protein
MNRIMDQKLEENESAEIRRAVVAWDQQASEDWLRLLELALADRGQHVRLVPLARAHAPEAMARVGAPKKA